MEPIIEVRQLVKHYPKVKAVNGINFKIPRGSCFGLLGPNGAGKTTTLELIEGLTTPTSGEILFCGRPIDDHFKEKSGIQFQSTALQDFLTAHEVLKLFRSFYKDPTDLQELSQLCGITEFWNRDTHTLSGGQRQRVLLAIALVNNPDVVFLDEPTTGLDPHARRNFWELVLTIKRQKKTIILTTHYMEEAYELCDEIAIMDRGTIIAHGAPDVLLKRHFDGVTLELPLENYSQLDSGKLQGKIVHTGSRVQIRTNQVNEDLRVLIDSGISLAHLKIRSQTLEDLFLELTGKELTQAFS